MIYSVYGSIEANRSEAKFITDVEAISAEEAERIVSIEEQEKYTVLAPTYFWAERKEKNHLTEITSWSKLKESFIDLFDQRFWSVSDRVSSIIVESEHTTISLETCDVNGLRETCSVSLSCDNKEFIDIGIKNVERLRVELTIVENVLRMEEGWKERRFSFDPCLDEEERAILDDLKKGSEICTKPVFSGCISDMIAEIIDGDSKRKVDWTVFEKLWDLGFLRLVKKTYLGATYKLI